MDMGRVYQSPAVVSPRLAPRRKPADWPFFAGPFTSRLDRVLKWMLVLVGVLVVMAGIAVAVLAIWEMPPPSARVERVIPNDRLPR